MFPLSSGPLGQLGGILSCCVVRSDQPSDMERRQRPPQPRQAARTGSGPYGTAGLEGDENVPTSSGHIASRS